MSYTLQEAGLGFEPLAVLWQSPALLNLSPCEQCRTHGVIANAVLRQMNKCTRSEQRRKDALVRPLRGASGKEQGTHPIFIKRRLKQKAYIHTTNYHSTLTKNYYHMQQHRWISKDIMLSKGRQASVKEKSAH